MQLYASPDDGETRKLVGFASVRLEAAEHRSVRIPVDRDALATWTGEEMSRPSGEYTVHVGFSRGDLARDVLVFLD